MTSTWVFTDQGWADVMTLDDDRTENDSATIKRLFTELSDSTRPSIHGRFIALAMKFPCEYDEWCEGVKS